ncbi:MAG: beta-lactamase family protein [Acidobacteria bacterium]|nr:beta-lactamase family protein [Acidobacteriota bacterium]
MRFPVWFCALLAPVLLAQGSAQFDAVVQPYADRKEFMGAVLVAKGDSTVFAKAYGFANLEWDVPNTMDTRFRIGSLSKQFTAVAILLLAQQGRLDLNASVTQYLPDVPAAWKQVTIHHLLSHTAGIPNVTALPGFATRRLAPSQPGDLIRLFRDLPLEFAPGSDWRYSNSGYIVLAHVVDKITGQPFVDFLREQILKPAGLKDTDSDSHRMLLRHRASGYTPFQQGAGNADYTDMTVPIGGGSLYSTAADLHRWTLRLHRGQVIGREWVQRMTTPVAHDYGYGLAIRNDKLGSIYEHGGSINGFNAFLAYRAAGQIVVVVLANLNTRAVGPIAQRLGDVAEQ